MKIYRNIIIVISVLITAGFFFLCVVNTPLITSVIKGENPTQEEYSLWEGYCKEIAKNWSTESITDKDVRPSYEFVNNKEVVVKIYSYKYGIIFEATYPISIKVQDDKSYLQAEYENGEYKETYSENSVNENKIWSFIEFGIIVLIIDFLFAALFYILFYKVVKDIYDGNCKDKDKDKNE